MEIFQLNKNGKSLSATDFHLKKVLQAKGRRSQEGHLRCKKKRWTWAGEPTVRRSCFDLFLQAGWSCGELGGRTTGQPALSNCSSATCPVWSPLALPDAPRVLCISQRVGDLAHWLYQKGHSQNFRQSDDDLEVPSLVSLGPLYLITILLSPYQARCAYSPVFQEWTLYRLWIDILVKIWIKKKWQDGRGQKAGCAWGCPAVS